MPAKNYTLFCHGSVSATATMEDAEYGPKYPQLNIPSATIPDNVTVVFYIPPGTIFNATSGVTIFNHVSNCRPEALSDTSEYISAMRGILRYRTRTPDRPGETREFLNWDTSDLTFPRVVTQSSNNDFAYDYNLKGQRDKEKGSALDTVKWGLWENGLGASRSIHALPSDSDTSTMTEILQKAADDAPEDEVIVHAIFCRVEVLTSDATDGAFPKSDKLAWTSMRIRTP